MRSLKGLSHPLADGNAQLRILSDQKKIPAFSNSLKKAGLFPLRATRVEVLQVNVGKVCNQTCRHCHVDAGPDRREAMDEATFRLCLDALSHPGIHTLDITGGAPEMNPQFRWFVEEARKLGKKILVRCNLTIIVSNPKFNDLPVFFRENGVEVISSLPYFQAKRTDSQRGEGVFERSIRALKMLNDAGYGKDPRYVLNLVYNPAGPFLPAGQTELEAQFKQRLHEDHDVQFNNLFCITNLPISRFLEYLKENDKLEDYLELLANAFNPVAAESVMCRNMISVGWDGQVYDCDFNQMLELPVGPSAARHIGDFNSEILDGREILTANHCYGCTAGAGSSCGGQTT